MVSKVFRSGFAGFAAFAVMLASAVLLAQEVSIVPSEVSAASALGQGDSAVLTLVRELTEWKRRAVTAEERLGIAGTEGASLSPGGAVVGSLESERVLVVSLGRSNGAFPGAMVSVGGGLVAKIVEARESVSAALVENSYKGSLVKLEGLPVRLSVRF